MWVRIPPDSLTATGNGVNLSYKMEAYGDSAGVGASDQCGYAEDGSVKCKGYNGRIAEAVAAYKGVEVTLDNDSVGGYRIGNIYVTIKEDLVAVQEADLITFDGGGNDWRLTRNRVNDGRCDAACINNTLEIFKYYWDATLDFVEANKKPEAEVMTLGYFYPFVREDKRAGTYNKLANLLNNMNTHAKQASEAKGFHYAELIPTFNISLYSPTDPRTLGLTNVGDELHPNSKGHEEIAKICNTKLAVL